MFNVKCAMLFFGFILPFVPACRQAGREYPKGEGFTKFWRFDVPNTCGEPVEPLKNFVLWTSNLQILKHSQYGDQNKKSKSWNFGGDRNGWSKIYRLTA